MMSLGLGLYQVYLSLLFVQFSNIVGSIPGEESHYRFGSARKPLCGNSLSTVPVIKSYPGAFVGWVWYIIISLTSFVQVFCSGRSI